MHVQHAPHASRIPSQGWLLVCGVAFRVPAQSDEHQGHIEVFACTWQADGVLRLEALLRGTDARCGQPRISGYFYLQRAYVVALCVWVGVCVCVSVFMCYLILQCAFETFTQCQINESCGHCDVQWWERVALTGFAT